MVFLLSWEKAFEYAVSDIASPLFDEFGFKFDSVNRVGGGSAVTGMNACMSVSIALEEKRIYVGILPTGHDVWEMLNLSWIIRALAPEGQFEPKRLKSPRQVGDEVKRQLELLLKYGRGLLEGDLELWGKVKTFADQSE